MSKMPSELKYTRSHEWVRSLANGQVEVGITDHAQEALGDLVFVEVPQLDRRVDRRRGVRGGRIRQGGIRCL